MVAITTRLLHSGKGRGGEKMWYTRKNIIEPVIQTSTIISLDTIILNSNREIRKYTVNSFINYSSYRYPSWNKIFRE